MAPARNKLSLRGRGERGVAPARTALEQPARCGEGRHDRSDATDALRRFRRDAGQREASRDRGRLGVEGDGPADPDPAGALAAQAAARQEDLPGSRTPAALWRTHPDRREPARLVRGPGGALHADRVHRRRHRSVDASAICPAETTKAYLQALEAHVLAHGLPLAFYSDRHGIFRVNAKEAQGGDGFTEFGRVVERLRIELIHVTTLQAKGRVERANQTLQDRLIKDMRLAGVSSIDQAQAFADGFLERWNARFAVAPRQAEDAHRPWSGSKADLAQALARREERTLSKALTFSAGATRYAVKTQGPGTALRGAKVTLLHMLDGTLRVRFKDRDLAFTPFKTLPVPPPAEDDKTLDARLDAVIARNGPSPTGSSRKGVDNGLARYGAMGGALRQAVIHPHSTHSPLSDPT